MFLQSLLEPASRPHLLNVVRTGKTLASRLETAFESASRRRGLLGRDGMAPGSALIIAPCGGVHTCFMRFPIDLVLVAKTGRIIQLRHDLRPWRIALSLRAFAAIELPAGALRVADVWVGDRLVLSGTPMTTSSD